MTRREHAANLNQASNHRRVTRTARYPSGLRESLNIIYGKNGRGKTTVLHILANILERDFARFRHLQFKRIYLETHQGGVLEITPVGSAPDRYIAVSVNSSATTQFIDESSQLTPAEESLIADVLGPRAVYLPAFRAILERVTEQARYAQDPARQKELERIAQSEHLLSRSKAATRYRQLYLRRDEQSNATATKTVQCRQWFGSFVPIIRYPSLGDVTDRLSAELRDAQMEMATVEQKVFSESFTRVFDAIAASESAPATKSKVELLKDVSAAVSSITTGSGPNDSNIYSRILSAVTKLHRASDDAQGVTNRVLALYAELLQHRSDEQERLFSRIGEFERSVNKFLDGKRLVVDGVSRQRPYRTPAIYSGSGRPLSLSSLSSGERQVLTMIFCASRLAEDNGIFLVDEPELSLHIDWQRGILSEVMRQAGSRQVIACTHSPEVGAEHRHSIQMFEPNWVLGPGSDADFSSDEDLEITL